jgi:hypothetical protein
VTTLPAAIGTGGSSARTARSDHSLLVAVRGVHDEGVHTGRDQRHRLAGDITVDTDRGGDPKPTLAVEGGSVEGGAQRALPGEYADQPPLHVHHRGKPATPLRQPVEPGTRVGLRRHGVQLGGHDVAHLREPVDADGVRVGDQVATPDIIRAARDMLPSCGGSSMDRPGVRCRWRIRNSITVAQVRWSRCGFRNQKLSRPVAHIDIYRSASNARNPYTFRSAS